MRDLKITFENLIFLKFFFESRGENQGNNLAIFGLFLNLQELFLNRGLIFETSDFIFCDLPNELFHIKETFFEKKSNSQKLFWSPMKRKCRLLW